MPQNHKVRSAGITLTLEISSASYLAFMGSMDEKEELCKITEGRHNANNGVGKMFVSDSIRLTTQESPIRLRFVDVFTDQGGLDYQVRGVEDLMVSILTRALGGNTPMDDLAETICIAGHNREMGRFAPIQLGVFPYPNEEQWHWTKLSKESSQRVALRASTFQRCEKPKRWTVIGAEHRTDKQWVSRIFADNAFDAQRMALSIELGDLSIDRCPHHVVPGWVSCLSMDEALAEKKKGK